jgi:hypothetical protein
MSEKQQQAVQEQDVQQGEQVNSPQNQGVWPPPRADGYRPAVVRESRIKDRPYKKVNDTLKIKIELDLEVEVRSPPQ